MRTISFFVLQFLLAATLLASYRAYEGEKEEYRRFDEGGGAYAAPGWDGGVELAPDLPDPSYDSTVDEDMLFDSYHNR